MNTNLKKKFLFWGIDFAYAIVFGLIIGVDFGFDVSKRFNKFLG